MVIIGHKMGKDIIKCACTNKKCEGICKDTNLYRKRKVFDCCTAAISDKMSNGRIKRIA